MHLRGARWGLPGCSGVLCGASTLCAALLACPFTNSRPPRRRTPHPPTHSPRATGPHDAITSRFIPLALGAAGAIWAAQGFYPVVFGIGRSGGALRAAGCRRWRRSTGLPVPASTEDELIPAAQSGRCNRSAPSRLSACTLQASWSDEESRCSMRPQPEPERRIPSELPATSNAMFQ